MRRGSATATLLAAAVMAGGACRLARHHTRGHDSVDERECAASTTVGFASGFHEIAAQYRRYPEVNWWVLWAPTRCYVPPPSPILSRSDRGTAHGSKLFYLFARNLEAYLGSGAAEQPVGQALVKETWIPRGLRPGEQVPWHERATAADGKVVAPGLKGPLFVMYKLGPATKDTDRGWVYGTLTPDGRQVTSAGRVASCMSCHDRGTRDRLFGPAP